MKEELINDTGRGDQIHNKCSSDVVHLVGEIWLLKIEDVTSKKNYSKLEIRKKYDCRTCWLSATTQLAKSSQTRGGVALPDLPHCLLTGTSTSSFLEFTSLFETRLIKQDDLYFWEVKKTIWKNIIWSLCFCYPREYESVWYPPYQMISEFLLTPDNRTFLFLCCLLN